MSVVIPTFDREDLLARAAAAIGPAAALLEEPVEVVVADDSRPPARHRTSRWTVQGVPVRRIFTADSGGRGPAAARNAGVAAAQYDVIAFTDDDARCDPRWLAVAVERLRADAGLAGLEGAVAVEPAYPVDPVRSRLVVNLTGGAFLTASLFVRHAAIDAVGGFRPSGSPEHRWAVPYREDTDLALRVIDAVGPMPFTREAVVFHPPEAVSIRRLIRLAGYFIVDAEYLRGHPELSQPVWRRPLARARIRLATAIVLLTPLLATRRSRAPATISILVLAGVVSAQFELELRSAGIDRPPLTAAANTLRRLPRSLLWSLVAGAARLQGEALMRLRSGPVRGGRRCRTDRHTRSGRRSAGS